MAVSVEFVSFNFCVFNRVFNRDIVVSLLSGDFVDIFFLDVVNLYLCVFFSCFVAFKQARAFNVDISKWIVGAVTDMTDMFYMASSFNRVICGPAWMNSTATQTDMFTGSHGSICGAPFAPADSDALKTAVAACLKETGDGSCPIFAASTNVVTGLPYRAMEAWDIRSVTDLRSSKY